jgi:DNA adenine methylase
MRYFGGKSRINDQLCSFLNKQLKTNQPFVDLFCGACNIINKIELNRLRIANDKHYYLIEMFRALQKGWIPPTNVSKEQYLAIKNNKYIMPYLSGFVGFGCSLGGKWFSGYAADNTKRNYTLNAHNSILKKMRNLKNVKFQNKDYKEAFIPFNSLIYCDVPYKNATNYCKNEVGIFNHDEFYEWLIYKSKKGYKIFVSEYEQNVPTKFEIVLSINSKKDMNKAKTTEVLFTYKV